MALQNQIIPINFAKGVDTKTDPKQLTPGTPTVLENAVLTETGDYTKRLGYNPLTLLCTDAYYSRTSIAHGKAFTGFNSSLSLLDGLSLFEYVKEPNTWVNRGPLPIATISSRETESSARNATGISSSMNSAGLLMQTWLDFDYSSPPQQLLKFCLADTTNNTLLTPTVKLGTSSSSNQGIRSVPAGTGFIILMFTSTGNVQYVSVDPANPLSIPAPVTIETDYFPGGVFDVVQNSTGTVTYVTYLESFTFKIKILKLDTTTTTPSIVTTLTTAVATIPSLAYDALNDYLWLFYSDGTNAKYTIFDNTLTTVTAPVNIVTPGLGGGYLTVSGVVTNGIGYAYVDYTFSPVGYTPRMYNTRIYELSTSAVVRLITYIPDTLVYGKPFVYTDPYYGTTDVYSVQQYSLYNSGLDPQNSYFLIKVDTTANLFRVVTKFAPGVAGTNTLPLYKNVMCVPPTPNTFIFSYLVETSTYFTGTATQTRLAIKYATFDFVSEKPKFNSLSGDLHIGGGYLAMFDGSSAVEHSFFAYPQKIQLTDFGVGSLSAGLYGYTAVYEWLDAVGNLHQSTTAIPVEISVAASREIKVQLPYLYLTHKTNLQNGVNIGLYRTTANGTIYYRVATLPVPVPTIDVEVVSYLDNLPDSSLIQNDQLYTTGGEVDNFQVPATNLLAQFKNRIIAVDAENPYQWWFSKQVQPQTPVEFSDVFTQTIDAKGGPIKAVIAMDDKLLFFKDNIIFYVVGDGPSPNGTNNDFSYPQIITTDVGCSNPDSVVLTPMGIMFQSYKGIYLLDRALNTSYIGAPVEGFNNRRIVGATLIPNTTQVRFLTDLGTSLVYDYFYQQWPTFTNQLSVDCTNYNNSWARLNSDGKVLVETSGVYTDDSAYYSMKIVTGWFNFAGLQGFKRLKSLLLLADYKSPHNLTVQFAHDFDPTIQQTVTIPVLSSITPEQFRVFLTKQKGESVQFTIQDTPLSGSGQSLTLASLSFNVAAKKGFNKMPAASSFG